MDNLAIAFTNKNRLAGQRFGRLTVIEKTTTPYDKSGNLLWRCLCDCGNEVFVRKTHLGEPRNGKISSCGCYAKEIRSNNRKKAIAIKMEGCSPVGKRYGLLSVKKEAFKKKISCNKRIYYECLCLCGGRKDVLTDYLKKKRGHPTSCGCRGKGLIEKFQDTDGLIKWRLIETKQVIPIGLWEE